MAFTLPALPYAFDALEPHIDATTMQIHHGKHHQAYVDNLNKAIAGTPTKTKLSKNSWQKRVISARPFVTTAAATGITAFSGKSLRQTLGGAPSGKLADDIKPPSVSLDI